MLCHETDVDTPLDVEGSGFVRVPNPRQYDMPASKPIENDPDSAEIYSLSALHQIHCLVRRPFPLSFSVHILAHTSD